MVKSDDMEFADASCVLVNTKLLASECPDYLVNNIRNLFSDISLEFYTLCLNFQIFIALKDIRVWFF